MNIEKDLNIALISNLKLKAKIMALMFGVIFLIQVIVISVLAIRTDVFSTQLPFGKVIVGPLMILAVSILEFYSIRYFSNAAKEHRQISPSFVYLVTFCEISFPTILMIFAASFIGRQHFLEPAAMLASPPGLIYFILIILSAFTLDRKICFFSGLVAAVEYIAFSAWFLTVKFHYSNDLPNNIFKGVLMLVCGIVVGLVSKRIRDAVMISLQSKNQLIHKLDILVNEKTAEINMQKLKLEEKNKEIMDSIHYAKRIQTAHLPTEKYLHKHSAAGSQTLRNKNK